MRGTHFPQLCHHHHETLAPHMPLAKPQQKDCVDCFGAYMNYTPTLFSGVDDADMVIYVAASEDLKVKGADDSTGTLCSQTTLAFTFACSINQFDRPVIRAINFCLENILTSIGNIKSVGQANDPVADVTYVAIHEVVHALGVSLNLFKYFQNSETGEPLTL